jgi:hypothetical protein
LTNILKTHVSFVSTLVFELQVCRLTCVIGTDLALSTQVPTLIGCSLLKSDSYFSQLAEKTVPLVLLAL